MTTRAAEERATLFAVAPEISELQAGACTVLVPVVDEEDREMTTEPLALQLPAEAYPRLAAGRARLEAHSDGWWVVVGQWHEGEFVAEEIREGTDSLNRPERTLWTRSTDVEMQQDTGKHSTALDGPGALQFEGEGPTLDQARGKAFYLTLSATDNHIDPYADPADWPSDPEPPWARDADYAGPGPSESARFRVELPDEAHAAIAAHIEETGASYHNWWEVTGAPTEAQPFVLVGDEVLHYQEFASPPAFVWRSERLQMQLAEEEALIAQLDREQVVEGMQALGLNPDNPEAVAAYQEWLECDQAPWEPPGPAQSLAYDRMMTFAAPAAEQQLVEEEWGDCFTSPQGGQGAERQRQHETELE